MNTISKFKHSVKNEAFFKTLFLMTNLVGMDMLSFNFSGNAMWVSNAKFQILKQ